jgi:hypothetical protein
VAHLQPFLHDLTGVFMCTRPGMGGLRRDRSAAQVPRESSAVMTASSAALF